MSKQKPVVTSSHVDRCSLVDRGDLDSPMLGDFEWHRDHSLAADGGINWFDVYFQWSISIKR